MRSRSRSAPSSHRSGRRRPSATCWSRAPSCTPTIWTTTDPWPPFTAFVLAELAGFGSAIVHDRYQNYDSAELGTLIHQLCTAHLLRDLDGAAQVYPDAVWPVQIADALRGLIGPANLAREQGHDTIDADTRDTLITRFRNGVLVGLSGTTSAGSRPGQRKIRLLLDVLRDRPADVLRFAHDLTVLPTSNQAERDLRPQQGPAKHLRAAEQRETHPRPLHHPWLRLHATEHGLTALTVLRVAITGQPWIPALPAPT